MENIEIKDKSTYGAIFAIMLIIVVVLALEYNSLGLIRNKNRDIEKNRNKVIIVQEESKDLADNERVLFENLGSDEVEKILLKLINEDEKDLDELQEILQ